MSSEKTCLICGNKQFTPIYQNTLLKCGSCGFITANLEIDQELLKNTYTENYFMGEEYTDYVQDKAVLQRNFKKRLNYIRARLNKRKISKALEIGCAYGFFGEIMKNELPEASYIGYDIVEEAIRYGREKLRQNVFCKDYLEVHSSEKYSDIFMWDVIEHLPYPEKFIAKASSEIEKGGQIYITTGDISAFIPRMQKEKWRMIHPPSHLHYFSRKTISMLLEAHGFKVKSVSYPPVSRSIKLIYYSLFMLRKNSPGFVKSLYKLIPARLYVPLNTFDIMFVIAEKV